MPVPPRESITPRPKKIIEDLQEFQQMQYDFLLRMESNLNEEATEFDADVRLLLESEEETYEKIWTYIDSL